MAGAGPIIYLKFPYARPVGWNDKSETDTWTKDKEEILIRDVLPIVSVTVAPDTGKRTLNAKYDWSALSHQLGMSVGSIQKKTMELYYMRRPFDKEDIAKPPEKPIDQENAPFKRELRSPVTIKTPDPTRPLRKMSGVYVSGERQTSVKHQPLEVSLTKSVESVDSVDSYGGDPVDATSRFLHRSLLLPAAPRTFDRSEENIEEEEDEDEDEEDALINIQHTGGSDTGVSSLSQSALENELLDQI